MRRRSPSGQASTKAVQHEGRAVFSFPPNIAQGLSGASAQDLAEVEITPSGLGLHWEKLDADFTVSGLLNGIFGPQAWMGKLYERWGKQPASPVRGA